MINYIQIAWSIDYWEILYTDIDKISLVINTCKRKYFSIFIVMEVFSIYKFIVGYSFKKKRCLTMIEFYLIRGEAYHQLLIFNIVKWVVLIEFLNNLYFTQKFQFVIINQNITNNGAKDNWACLNIIFTLILFTWALKSIDNLKITIISIKITGITSF